MLKLKQIELESMEFMAPFLKLTPTRTKNNKVRKIDYEKIELISKDNAIVEIYAGLAEDWRYTTFLTYSINDKKIKDDKGTCGYDHSFWATPAILICYENGKEESYECWKYI